MSEFKQWSFGLSLSAEALGLTALQWEQYRIKNNVKVEGDMLDCDIEPRPLSYSLRDYHNAPSGEGPQAYQWKDKPHRLLYDLIAAVRYYAELAKLSASATRGTDSKCSPTSTECPLCRNDILKCPELVRSIENIKEARERKPYGDLRNAKWLDPECYAAGACQSLKFKNLPTLTEAEIDSIIDSERWDTTQGRRNIVKKAVELTCKRNRHALPNLLEPSTKQVSGR